MPALDGPATLMDSKLVPETARVATLSVPTRPSLAVIVGLDER